MRLALEQPLDQPAQRRVTDQSPGGRAGGRKAQFTKSESQAGRVTPRDSLSIASRYGSQCGYKEVVQTTETRYGCWTLRAEALVNSELVALVPARHDRS